MPSEVHFWLGNDELLFDGMVDIVLVGHVWIALSWLRYVDINTGNDFAISSRFKNHIGYVR